MALSDLTTKGFCVIKNLFNADQINTIRQDFELIKNFEVNKHYPVLPVGKMVPLENIINSVVVPISKTISEETGLITDFNPTPVYFSISHGVDFDWHQDHESYFQSEDHFNYLNIYVPIYKPNTELSNVCVIDFEKLIKLDLQTEFLRNYGATRFVCKNGKTIIHDDNTDSVHELSFDINDIADCPQLEIGDALIMKGDCIHRTQDVLTNRVAMSIRRMYSKTKVKRSNFDPTSKAKEFVLSSNKEVYNKMIDKFKDRHEIELGELNNVHT
jgi:hypothetical protein